MMQMGTSNAIVNAMLSWLKWLASWVLRLFNLAGGFSPLRFLADNWLKLLLVLLIVGIVGDLLVWLIRWRPHWVWFHRKRVIINDKDFFAGEDDFDDEDEDWDSGDGPERRRNWRDDDFVVTGAAHRRREREREEARARRERAAGDVFTDDRFNIDAEQRASDRYEDDVFRVSDLPTRELRVEPPQPRQPVARGNSRQRRDASASHKAKPASRRR